MDLINSINWQQTSKVVISIGNSAVLAYMAIAGISPDTWYLAIAGGSLTWLFGGGIAQNGISALQGKSIANNNNE